MRHGIRNFGFVPMTENEFKYLAKDLKLILDPGFLSRG